MSITTTKTIEVIPDRTQRIVIDKHFNCTPTITTVDEQIVDGISRVTGNMSTQFDSENPKHMALYAAMEDVVAEMRVKRDTPVVVVPVVEEVEA